MKHVNKDEIDVIISTGKGEKGFYVCDYVNLCLGVLIDSEEKIHYYVPIYVDNATEVLISQYKQYGHNGISQWEVPYEMFISGDIKDGNIVFEFGIKPYEVGVFLTHYQSKDELYLGKDVSEGFKSCCIIQERLIDLVSEHEFLSRLFKSMSTGCTDDCCMEQGCKFGQRLRDFCLEVYLGTYYELLHDDIKEVLLSWILNE